MCFYLKNPGVLTVLQISGLMYFQEQKISSRKWLYGALVLCENSISVSAEMFVFQFHSTHCFFVVLGAILMSLRVCVCVCVCL